ncbi:Ohr family peroxiredoxin [Nocardioidaceae bacterium]|nr:Ohr family peroxiredoxin [Nocardioidaceae bacterium]
MPESLEKTIYTIAATSEGGRDGHVRSEDGVIDLELAKPSNTDTPKANPETLFASGYAACFAGAMEFRAKQEGIDVSGAKVSAAVSFGTTDTGVGLAVEITAEIPGLDETTAQQVADMAHEFCPYSKATRGNIDVTVVGRPA